jgi:acyl-CoA thioesterase-2
MPSAAGDGSELIAALTARPVGDDHFRAVLPNWFGGHAFGGMVVGQAVNAALQTVDTPGDLHSLHAYFLRPTVIDEPVDIDVERVRDGRSFTTRHVRSRQYDKTVFTMLCSFHEPETGDEYARPMPDVPAPEDLDDPPQEFDDDPPDDLEMRDAGPLLDSDGTYVSTRRVWFRLPLTTEDVVAHLTAIAYMSDMTGTSFRPHSLGEWGMHTDASLDHAVWFHRPMRLDDWILYDLRAVINHAGRSVVHGAMYSRDGLLRLSLMQELLIRPLPTGES